MKLALDEWAEAAHLERGVYFYPINKSERISTESLSAQATWKLVASY